MNLGRPCGQYFGQDSGPGGEAEGCRVCKYIKPYTWKQVFTEHLWIAAGGGARCSVTRNGPEAAVPTWSWRGQGSRGANEAAREPAGPPPPTGRHSSNRCNGRKLIYPSPVIVRPAAPHPGSLSSQEDHSSSVCLIRSIYHRRKRPKHSDKVDGQTG